MIRESKRNNTGVFRQKAIAYLGDFIEIFPEMEWSEPVHEIVGPVIESLLDDGQEMDVDSSTPGGPSSKVM